MGSLSPFHWIVVILVIVLLFGAKKIPELAKGLGLGVKEFKKALKEDDKEQGKETAAKKSDKKEETKV